jgi:integrase
MRPLYKLTAAKCSAFKGPGRICDGGSLYLQAANGGKSWTFIWERDGVERSMGLGSYRDVPLALARELATDCRQQLARGLDPIEARKAARLNARAERAKLSTFKQCAEDYLAANESKWRNAKHRKEWRATLNRHAYPVFGHLAVSAIDSALVVKALTPLIADKPVTAARLRGRIETVLDFAKAGGRRDGDNPADKTIISHMLPLRSEKAGVQHLPALPFTRLPAFMTALRATPGTTARLLELIVLSGMRLDAVRPARCHEVDLTAAVPVWTIPASRMKTLGRDHRVPLIGRALEVVQEQLAGKAPEAPLFGRDKPIGHNAIGKALLPNLLRAIGHAEPVTTHGFLSALKDWVHETTSFPHEVVEQVLGHRIKSAVERAYRRGELFDKRRTLLSAWDSYCTGRRTADVLTLRA